MGSSNSTNQRQTSQFAPRSDPNYLYEAQMREAFRQSTLERLQADRVLKEKEMERKRQEEAAARRREQEAAARQREQEAAARRREQEEEKDKKLAEYEASHLKPVIVQDAYFDLWLDANYSKVTPVRYIKLDRNTSQYKQILRKVSPKIQVKSIEQIENALLKRSYELKKDQKRLTFPHCEERLLFYAATEENCDDICRYNLNWRVQKDTSFGHGIKFSPNSTYAANVVKNLVNVTPVLLLFRVLVGKVCAGNPNMIIPDEEYDTSVKSTRKQPQLDPICTVKFEDAEFYPAYKIRYTIRDQI